VVADPSDFRLAVERADPLPRPLTELIFRRFYAVFGLEEQTTARADWRVLAWHGDEADDDLVGHVGIVERTVTVGGADCKVGGIAALVVQPEWRGRGLGRALMQCAEDVLHDETDAAYGHLICEPDRVGFYASLGWQEIAGPMVFTAWDGRRIAVGHRIMILPIRGDPWPDGPIDANGLMW